MNRTPSVARVVVVDDSATMRHLIRAGLEHDPGIEVIAEASSAREARDAVKLLSPDVLTLDIEMPGVDGLEFLKRLMKARPMPVIMVSTLTQKGSDAAVQALSLGAFECVEKPRFGTAQETFARISELIKAAASSTSAGPRSFSRSKTPPQVPSGWSWNGKWILLGSSTGGVEALQTVLSGFPKNCPPTLITQHMPPRFLESLAVRLNSQVAPTVRVARDGDRPGQGEVYIAPGGDTHLTLNPAGDTLKLEASEKRSGHRPSVDVMFGSAVPHANRMIAAILTGMGRDGAQEILALRNAGAVCVGQDEQSSVVYGMPRVAHELGGVERELPLSEISAYLLRRAAK